MRISNLAMKREERRREINDRIEAHPQRNDNTTNLRQENLPVVHISPLIEQPLQIYILRLPLSQWEQYALDTVMKSR